MNTDRRIYLTTAVVAIAAAAAISIFARAHALSGSTTVSATPPASETRVLYRDAKTPRPHVEWVATRA